MLTSYNNLLTTKGWKNVAEIEVGDEILTTNFAGHGIFSPVVAVTAKDYNGYIYDNTDYDFGYRWPCYLSVTEDSKIVRVKKSLRKSVLTGKTYTAQTLERLTIDDIEYLGIKKIHTLTRSPLQFTEKSSNRNTKLVKDGTITMKETDYFKFLAYLTVRGSIVEYHGKLEIAINYRDNLSDLTDLLNNYRVPHRVERKKPNNGRAHEHYIILMSNNVLAQKTLRPIMKNKLAKREIPKIVVNSKSPESLFAFIYTYLYLIVSQRSDGMRYSEKLINGMNFMFSPKSEVSSQALIDIFFKLGINATLSNDQSYKKKPIRIAQSALPWITTESLVKKPYNGKVYAIDTVNELAVCNPKAQHTHGSMVLQTN